MSKLERRFSRKRIHRRVRKKLAGTADRPRLCVFMSNQNVYAQVIDDDAGKTLAAASTVEADLKSNKANVDGATKVGEAIANRCSSASIGEVVFDRGGHRYHGKVKALADAAREGGLKF